jgi:hypothetical protein
MDNSVSAETVVAIYKEKLADANHKLVMLQASLIRLETELENLKKTTEDSE